MNRAFEFQATVISLAILLSSASAVGAEKRHRDAHVHGVAEVNIAVEGNKAEVEFRAPAESVMGFEYEAKSESDRKKRDAALKTVQTKMNQMVLFDPKLNCKWFEVKTVVVEEKEAGHDSKDHKKTGEHREVRATSAVACDKPLAGSGVTFGVYKTFPAIHEIKVQVISDAKQSGATIKKDKGEVRL